MVEKPACLSIASGGAVRPCRIRKDDELQELCAALNAAIARLAPADDSSEEFVDEWQLESAPSLMKSAQMKASEVATLSEAPSTTA